MTYQSHHCSATLPCSVCLNVFLHTCLALSVLLPFMFYASCPFNAPFLFCVFQLLHTASFYTPESLSTTTPIPSLFCVFILSVHLIFLHAHCLCMLFTVPQFFSLGYSLPLHIATTSPLKHQHTLSILHVLLVSIPLPDHHHNSSSFLVVIPMRSSSIGVMLRFLSLSNSRDSSSSLS
jgi:hypothetical protein